MRHPHRPRNSIKRHTARLGRKLDLGSHVEEREIAGDEVVRYAGRFIQDINLAAQNILCLLEVVGCRFRRPSFDFVEAGCEMCGRVGGLCADAGWCVRSLERLGRG
jgi:hypothetical protein